MNNADTGSLRNIQTGCPSIMKILYHHRTLAKDGMDVHIQELTSAFRQHGHELDIVGPQMAQATNATSISDAKGPSLVNRLRKAAPAAAEELLETLYSKWAERRLNAAFARLQPDIIYERYNLYLFAGGALRKRTGAPLVMEVNAPLAHERALHGRLALKEFAHNCEAKIWKQADLVLPVSDALADHVRRAGVPDDRIMIIPNGVNPTRFNTSINGAPVRGKLGLENKIVLGFTGFFREWHALDKIIRALPEIRKTTDAHFLIVGEGPIRAELEDLARDLGVSENVTFYGRASRDEIATLIAAFDIALQPAVTPYASPLKLFEYLALGKAVIAPDQSNIRELVTHGEDAYLFAPDDETAIARALIDLSANTELRRRLGVNAAALIEKRGFLWSENARRIEEAAKGLLQTRGNGARPE